MALTSGTRLGPYEMVVPLGAGGMGEVYRAKDTKLGREVAIKVLPATFTNDAERVARFRREAQVLASLNHPHIGAIYGLDEANGTRFLVLELVDGESLDKRIARGRIPVDEALGIAKQIAEALEAAHEKGIIHRDLKPANIALTNDGQVKVLDFGLAKAVETSGSVDAMNSPTITSPAMMTGVGVILGTAAYMSPEQAKGRAADKRSDIWAFGCVLFEMLTGRRAFGGDTVAEAFAAILEREPDWDAFSAASPSRARQLLQRCLEKDPRRRLHHIADVRIELEDLQALPPAALKHRGTARAGTLRWRPTVFVAAVMGAVAAVAAVVRYLTPAPPSALATRLSISASGRITPQLSAAISPDGRRVAFVSTDAGGRSMMWIRALDSLEARVVPGTEDAAHPFWSPDGQSLGFIAGGKLKRVDAEGGAVQTLAETAGFRTGGAWSRDGVIIFSSGRQLAAVPASGGPVSHLAASAIWPSFLPDGRHFLYWSSGGSDLRSRGVYVGSLDSSVTKQLISSDFKGAYAAPGYLLFVRDETLMAQPFDADSLKLSGEPHAVAEGVWGAVTAAQASFSVSSTGTLAYVNATLSNMQVLAFDRSGRPRGPVTQPDRYFDQVPQLSPSGKQLAIARGPYGHESVWLWDLATGGSTRFTLNPDWSHTPVWSSDGARVMFMSGRGPGVAGSRLNLKNVNGAGQDEVLLELTPPATGALWDWSSDGRFVVYSVVTEPRGVADLWVLPLDGARQPYPFLQSTFHKAQAQIAPNGKWLAYTSYESGKDEVYVESFPLPGSKRQISIDGGVQPRWRRDGAELFYLALNQTLMAVPIKTDGRFETGPPVPLFRTKILPQGSQSTWFFTAYDVSADGQRFLINGPPDDPGPQITVILNWSAAVKK